MSAIAEWLGFGSSQKSPAEVEMANHGGASMDEEVLEGPGAPEADEQLLPSMTEEEIEAYRFEKAKKARRQQLDVLFNSEVSLGATIDAVKKSLIHYEKQKLELYGKRQKYRLLLGKIKGPVDEVKMEAIKKLLHEELPALIDEMDDRIINGHAQLASLEKQLTSLKQQREKAERSYQRMFEPLAEGDLEGGVEVISDHSSENGKNVPIEVILAKYDPEYKPPPGTEQNLDDTSSSDGNGAEHQIEIIGADPHKVDNAAELVASMDLAESSSPLEKAESGKDLVRVPLD